MLARLPRSLSRARVACRGRAHSSGSGRWLGPCGWLGPCLWLGLCLAVPALLVACQSSPPRGALRITRVIARGAAGAQGAYHTYRIPALVRTRAGTLLAFFEGRKASAGDAGDIDMLCARSSDGGRTWSEPLLVWEDGKNTCGNPCAVVDRDTGRVWLAMLWGEGGDHERAILAGKSRDVKHVYVSSSGDDGRSWSEPTRISASVRAPHFRWYAVGPGNAIQLRHGEHAGRLLFPANHSDHREAGVHPYRSHVFWSDDHGASWQLGGVHEPQTNESAIVELANGDLLQSMRSYHGKGLRAQARSGDGGVSFGAVRLVPELETPVCQASMIAAPALGEDALLFTSPRGAKRAHLTVWCSLDGGKSWPRSREIYAGGAAYSSLVDLGEGAFGVLFERDGYRSIDFARFDDAWLAPAAR